MREIIKKGVQAVIDYPIKLCAYVSAVLVFVITMILSYDALARYFGYPTMWIGEVSVYAYVWLVFFATAYGFEKGSHFRVTVLSDRWSNKKQKQVTILTSVLGLMFSILLLKGGWEMVLTSFRFHAKSATTTHFPLFVPQIAVPLGALLTAIQLLKTIVKTVYTLREEK